MLKIDKANRPRHHEGRTRGRRGTVTSFANGTGFITDAQGNRLSVHQSALDGGTTLFPGDVVAYEGGAGVCSWVRLVPVDEEIS
jgi:cold shock CspA family protein